VDFQDCATHPEPLIANFDHYVDAKAALWQAQGLGLGRAIDCFWAWTSGVGTTITLAENIAPTV